MSQYAATPHSPYDQEPEKYVRRFSNLDPKKLAAALPGVPGADTEEGRLFRESIRQYDQRNLASSEPETVKSLTRLLQQWLADNGDPYVID